MKKTVFFLFTLLLGLGLRAQDEQKLATLPEDPAVRIGYLDNGLTYYIRYNGKPAQRAEFYLATDAGAIQETPDQDGLAHFLEHMCFNGLKNLPGKTMLEYLQSIGAQFGRNINASTGVEQTRYMLNNIPVVREGIIDTCLLVMHDYSRFVLLEQAEIDAERGVILEEKRTRNNASWRMYEKNKPFLFGDSKYAYCTIIGSEENLKTFKRESLVNFYNSWYRPDNQALIVVGDIDPDQIEAKIKALFSDIPAASSALLKETIYVPDNAEPLVGIVTDPEYPSSDISVLYKSRPMEKRLNNTLLAREERLKDAVIRLAASERFEEITAAKDAPFLEAELSMGRLCNTCQAFQGSVSFKDGAYEAAFSAFMTELERFRRYGITEGEFERAKAKLMNAYEKAVKSADSRKNADFVKPLLAHFFKNEPIPTPEVALEAARQLFDGPVTLATVNDLLRSRFTQENVVILYNGPEKVPAPSDTLLLGIFAAAETAQVSAPKETSVRTELIGGKLKAGKVRKEEGGLYGSTVWTLSNGVTVVVKPTDFQKNQVLIRLVRDGGLSRIPDADLLSFDEDILSAFDKYAGVGDFTSSELSKALSGKSLSMAPFFDNYQHGVSGQSAPKDLETAFQLLYLYYTSPRLRAEDYQMALDYLRPVLTNAAQTPEYQFSQRLSDRLYGGNPRARVLSPEDLDKASVEALRRGWKKLFSGANGATLYIIGDVNAQQLRPLVEKYVASLPKGCGKTSRKDNGLRKVEGEVIDAFETVMTTPKVEVCQVVHALRPYSVAADVELEAARYILRMVYTDVLREEMGGTYGAGVGAAARRYPEQRAHLQVSFDTNVAQADTMCKVARACLEKLADPAGISPVFFDRTARNFKKMIPERRISNSYWLSCLQRWREYDEDYDALYEQAVDALQVENVAKVFRDFCDSGNFFQLVMRPKTW
ncbi:MAG: insulinase family protein [Bacteroidales bacterium]|nr:insulinase family protein [Bacteroidales bacterium]